MSRSLPLAVLFVASFAVPSAAQAQEPYESEPRLFKFEEIKTVRSDALSIPLTFTLISGVAEDLGIVPTLTSNAEIALYLEGESNLHWPVIGTDSAVYHRITPIADSSFIGMRAGMNLTVAVQGRVFGSFFTFNIVSQNVNFEDEIQKFTPFMLPFQPNSVNIQLLKPTATNGSLRFPLTIPVLSSGVINLSVGATFRADPVSRGEVRGLSLDTIVTQASGFVDTFATDGSDLTSDQVFQNIVELYEQTPELEVTNQWVSEIGTALGYLIGVDLVFQVEVFGFPLSFDFNVWEQQFDLFPFLPEQQTFDASDDTAPYFHPLPMIEIGGEAVEFDDVPAGESKVFKYPVFNEGNLDLEGTVTIEGDPAFALAPNEIAISPGGQNGLNVTFSPPAPGEYRAKLVIASSDPAVPVVEIPVVGNSSKREGSDGGLSGNDNGLYGGLGGSTLYSTCGCASTTMSPSGLAPFAVVPFLVGLRRRRTAPST